MGDATTGPGGLEGRQARRVGIPADESSWALQRGLMEFLESNWREPDEGLWEVRGPRRHFTHSKVMVWVAADRAVKAVDHFGVDGPRNRWAALRTPSNEILTSQNLDSRAAR